MTTEQANRLTETYDYLRNRFGLMTKNRIAHALSNVNQAILSDALSLGGVRGPKIVMSDSKTRDRLALRTLLMVNLAVGDAVLADLPRLRESFKKMNEAQLTVEISYVLNYLSPDLVAHQVALAADSPPGNTIEWGRAGGANCMNWVVGTAETSQLTCYSSVIYWAFQGGAISHRFLKEWARVNALTGHHAHDGMGRLMRVDDAVLAHGAVPEGRTIFFQTPINKLGHTVLSLGNNNIASCNGVTPPPALVNETLTPGTIWNKMAHGKYHRVTLADLQRIYTPQGGYTYTAMPKPFWEYYPISER